MKFYDIVKKPNKVNYLKEAYTGQFTIGFELEGICTWDKYLAGEDFHLPSYGAYSERNQPTGGARILKEYLDKIFKIEGSSGESKIESDSSLNTSGISDLGSYRDAWNFEYATNKIPFNAKNLEIIYNGLSKLDEEFFISSIHFRYSLKKSSISFNALILVSKYNIDRLTNATNSRFS